jgi:hypothetical protein
MDREVEVGDGTRLLVRGMEDDGRVVNVDVEIVEATGARWVATVLTLAEISRLMRSYRESGECLSGRYSRVPDLMILDTPTFESLTEVVEDLLASGAHASEFAAVHDEG